MLLLQTVKHLSFLNKMRAENQYGYRLMVDGGVDTENAAACIAAGADILVAGALAIYGQADSLANCAKRFMRLEKPK
jgi:pentose-5-phosphate-3-epimerase